MKKRQLRKFFIIFLIFLLPLSNTNKVKKLITRELLNSFLY